MIWLGPVLVKILLVGAILRLIYLPRSGKVWTFAGFAPQPNPSRCKPLKSRLRPGNLSLRALCSGSRNGSQLACLRSRRPSVAQA